MEAQDARVIRVRDTEDAIGLRLYEYSHLYILC